MNKLFVLATLTILVAACAASPHVSDEKKTGSGKLGITQTGARQNAEYVLCETDSCPQRTQKFLPTPSAAPKQLPPVVERAVPMVVHFKVYFPWGWSRLDAAGHQEVDAVVASSHLKNAKKVVVAGRTDPTGRHKSNEKLAIERAKTVKAALVLAGVSAEVITAEAQTPCCDGGKGATPEAMRELRRTDIDITITTK